MCFRVRCYLYLIRATGLPLFNSDIDHPRAEASARGVPRVPSWPSPAAGGTSRCDGFRVCNCPIKIDNCRLSRSRRKPIIKVRRSGISRGMRLASLYAYSTLEIDAILFFYGYRLYIYVFRDQLCTHTHANDALYTTAGLDLCMYVQYMYVHTLQRVLHDAHANICIRIDPHAIPQTRDSDV